MYLHIQLIASLCLATSWTSTAQDHNAARVKRIINGEESDHSESKFLVSLQGDIKAGSLFGLSLGSRKVYCGGTLISNRWVLTAAHCFEGSARNAKFWHARFASPNIEMSAPEAFMHFLGKLLDVQSFQQLEYHAEKIVVHPRYNAEGEWENDIALVKLKEEVPISMTDRVGLIDPATPGEMVDRECTVYGWGCNELGRSVQKKINKAVLPIIPDNKCHYIWGLNMTSRICAGGVRGYEGSACHGDSGGPLVCLTEEGEYIQAGVISFVHSIEPTVYPVVFTRVCYYKQWIADIIES